MPFNRDIKMKKHVAKCVIKFEKELATKEDVPSLAHHEAQETKDNCLEFVGVMNRLYLVRKSRQGTGFPLQVRRVNVI